jgi:superoxide dismutase
MWEHAFVFDFQPSGKKQYIESFFENLNWEVIEENFNNTQ